MCAERGLDPSCVKRGLNPSYVILNPLCVTRGLEPLYVARLNPFCVARGLNPSCFARRLSALHVSQEDLTLRFTRGLDPSFHKRTQPFVSQEDSTLCVSQKDSTHRVSQEVEAAKQKKRFSLLSARSQSGEFGRLSDVWSIFVEEYPVLFCKSVRRQNRHSLITRAQSCTPRPAIYF